MLATPFPFPSAIAIKSGTSRIVSRISADPPNREIGLGRIGDINGGSSLVPAVKRGRHNSASDDEEDLIEENGLKSVFVKKVFLEHQLLIYNQTCTNSHL